MAKRISEIIKNGITYKVGSQYTAGSGISITNDVISVTLDTTLFIIVQSLPTSGIQTNKIYLVPSEKTADKNVYIEYLYVNGSWEKIGEVKSDTDLSNYYNKTEVDGLLSNKVNIESGKSLLSDTDKAIYDTTATAVTQIPNVYETKADAQKKVDVVLTQSQYDALATKEASTTYFIYAEE